MTTKRHRERLHSEPAAAEAEDDAVVLSSPLLTARAVAELTEMIARLNRKLDAAMEQVAVILTAPAAPEPVPVPAAKKLNGRHPLLVPPPRPRRDLFDIGQDD